MKLPIYLDYSATTPVDPRVAAKMIECLTNEGNFIKTIYSTYCGHIQSKFWGSNYTMMNETINWDYVRLGR